MAQTTGAIARSGFKVEVSTDGVTWKDISGAATNVTNDGGDALVGDQMTAEGMYAIVTAGNKTEPRNITVSAVYTEIADEPWKVVYAAYVGADKRIAVRWSPAGGKTGDQRLATSIDAAGYDLVPIASCTLPELDASSGDPALFEFVVRTPAIYSETVGT